MRFDTDCCYQNSSTVFAVDAGQLRGGFVIGSEEYRSDTFAAVFFRHIKMTVPTHVDDPDVRRLVESEQSAALEGSILALEPALWVNHPHANRLARNKVLQLRIATRLGFDVPDTVVTDDPAIIRQSFTKWDGRMVSKLVGGQLVGRTVEDQFLIHTTRIASADLDVDASLAAAPAIYQQLIPKSCDVRVTVVGEKLFGCRIDSQDSTAGGVDWRAAGYRSLTHVPLELPERIRSLCCAITRAFGLHMAGIDLIQRPDGSFVFLEINAAGQWAWVEEMTGLPIAAAIAEQLIAATE